MDSIQLISILLGKLILPVLFAFAGVKLLARLTTRWPMVQAEFVKDAKTLKRLLIFLVIVKLIKFSPLIINALK